MRMRSLIALLALTACVVQPTWAHGPQIQITVDNNKLVTRELKLDGSYSTELSSHKMVYVMPVQPLGSVWYSRPNGEIDPITLLPAFPSGPGVAYGYDLANGGPQDFEAGGIFSIGFTDGLKLWNGAAFGDAGATQLKAFRGSNAEISTPAANFAITSDSGPFDDLSLPAVVADYGSEGAEVHNSIRYALLGDGVSSTSASPDGVYLLSLRLSSTQAGLNPSEPYYFVLNKNAPYAALLAAVNSLNVAGGQVQWLVPEPGSILLASISAWALTMTRIRNAKERYGK